MKIILTYFELIICCCTCFSQTENKTNSIISSTYFDPIEATFPGGSDSLYQFINLNNKLTSTIYSKEGKVVVQFLIDSLGIINNLKIVRHLSDSCDNESLRIMTLMPNWIPALDVRGKPTSMQFLLPILFKSNK